MAVESGTPAAPAPGATSVPELSRPTINLIGCGRVGLTLARCFEAAGVATIGGLHARTPERAGAAVAFVGAGRPVTALADLGPADLWLLTVPDVAIAPVAEDLAAVVPTRAGAPAPIAIHCSGYWPASVLAPLAARGFRCASVHPVRSFADPALAAAAFDGTPCGLEGDPGALAELEPLFNAIGGQCFRVASDRKALYHAAAVFASNFTVVLQSLAAEAWQDAGVPDEIARRIGASLVRGTLDNVARLGPAAAITGPAARGDKAVVDAQGAVVADWNPAAGRVYPELSRLARRLAVGGSTRDRARRLRIHGRVQGVGYRFSMVAEARRLGVAGWVRNRPDGSVEAWLEGAPGACDRLEAWARHGPAGARVTGVDVESVAPEGREGFVQRPTG